MTESSFKFDLPAHHKSIIKVIGVGGGGSNAVNHMYSQGITGVEFIVCNTDVQALNVSPINNKLQIGINLTEGLGAGANPERGMNAALENKEEIRSLLSEDTKMVFITAGMGGGTGTGAAPVIAQVAKELGILTVGIVTVPFKFEGKKKMRQAMEGVRALKENCDTVLVILNDKLKETFGNLGMREAFAKADNVLTIAAKSIAEIITVTADVNVDFEDVKTVMKNSGGAVMGSSVTSGENRALRAAEEAITSPLLNNQSIKGADKILLSITSGTEAELQMDELSEITDFMQDLAGDEADVIFGHGVDASLGDSIRLTIIATGFEEIEDKIEDGIEGSAPVARLETPIARLEEPKKVFDLQREQLDIQTNLFEQENLRHQSEEITSRIVEQPEASSPSSDDSFEAAYQKKLDELHFEAPAEHRSEPILSPKEDPLDAELRELMEETKNINLPPDAPLEELNGMAHPPSRKVILMQQSEDRRRHLSGLNTDETIDTGSYKEKFEVPAYQRKNVSLKDAPAAAETLVSKYNLNGESQLGNNKFLHDRPD